MTTSHNMSSRRLWRSAGVILLLATAACASPPPTASVAIPPIPAGEARVWFYRPVDAYDSLSTPYIRMNDAIVGVSLPNGASYRDVAAGQYHISVDSYLDNPQQDQNVTLAPGQEVFVKVVSLRSWIQGGAGGGGGEGGGGGGDYSRDSFYVWQIPPEVAQGEVARSQFYGGG
jgi:hypothetical protein